MLPAPDLSALRCEPSDHRSDGCITCGDEAVALRVLSVDDSGLALCENEAGQSEDVEVGLIDPVAPGDRVLVHAATAIANLR